MICDRMFVSLIILDRVVGIQIGFYVSQCVVLLFPFFFVYDLGDCGLDFCDFVRFGQGCCDFEKGFDDLCIGRC